MGINLRRIYKSSQKLRHARLDVKQCAQKIMLSNVDCNLKFLLHKILKNHSSRKLHSSRL